MTNDLQVDDSERNNRKTLFIYPYSRTVILEDIIFTPQKTKKESYTGKRYEFELREYDTEENHQARVFFGDFHADLHKTLEALTKSLRNKRYTRIIVYQNEQLPKGVGFADPFFGNNLENISEQEYQEVVNALQINESTRK
ncbi:MAG: hypothetical protein AABX86_01335 [Nanoarchaeota archaeon]